MAGALLSFVALFTLFVSTLYNQVGTFVYTVCGKWHFVSHIIFYSSSLLYLHKAIATANTEIIMNSVVILFITNLDKLLVDIFMALNMSSEKISSSEVRVDENATVDQIETMGEKMGKCKVTWRNFRWKWVSCWE